MSAGRPVQALSLDVVAGGLAGGALAASMTGARLPLAWWPILGGAIWVIYAVDHLLDARRVGGRRAGARYRLHARHAAPIAIAAGFVAILCAAAAWAFLPREVVVGGLLLGGAGAVHLAVAQLPTRRWMPKEISVALIYTAGIWLAPALLARRFGVWLWLAAALHFAAVLLNMAMYSVFEARRDAYDDSASLSRLVRPPVLVRGVILATSIAIGVACLGLIDAPHSQAPAWCALALLNAVPILCLVFPARVVPKQRYRILGELSFLVLAVPYLIHALA